MFVELSTKEEKHKAMLLCKYEKLALRISPPFAVFMAERPAVPERELQIAHRLRDARKKLLISQTLFAQKAEITQPRLAKYELGAVPLPWWTGDLICATFGIDQIWLGTGKGEMWGQGMLLDERLVNALGARPWFSTVIDEIVVPFKEDRPPSARVKAAIRKIGEQAAKRDMSAKRSIPARRPVGPFMSPSQSAAWNEFASGPLRSAFASVKNDDLVDFSRKLVEFLEKVHR